MWLTEQHPAEREAAAAWPTGEGGCRRTRWLGRIKLFRVKRFFDIDGHMVKTFVYKNILLVLDSTSRNIEDQDATWARLLSYSPLSTVVYICIYIYQIWNWGAERQPDT